MRNDIAWIALLWLILAKADSKLLKHQLLNDFWQYLIIGASFWNLNNYTHFVFPIGNWKHLNFFATDKNKIESKFKFQGQSARSQQWFDLDLDWMEVNFSTRESDFYKKFFKATTIHKILIYSEAFKFQLEMQNVWNHLSFKMMPQLSSIVRNHWIAFVSVV